jgi:molybdopterin-guanine dinucleotide biosynthesis protein A
MGHDKAWVEFGGKPLVQLAVEKVRELGIEEIFISGRAGEDYAALKCPVLFDLEPGFGPLGGIERGLCVCSSPLLLVLAVDLPQMSPALLARMQNNCDRLTGMASWSRWRRSTQSDAILWLLVPLPGRNTRRATSRRPASVNAR